MRNREWGVAVEEENQIMELVEDVDELVFDQYHLADSDDEDDFGFGRLRIRDLVGVELWQMFNPIPPAINACSFLFPDENVPIAGCLSVSRPSPCMKKLSPKAGFNKIDSLCLFPSPL